MPNALAQASSPYLRQHADNPVDWLPWGEEAFARARTEDKPVFLSIGYATCHWCHVMAHESFESTEIAELLNRNFICIKVDREERPDVDRVYMTYVQALSGRGGWPLSVFLTPELKPFFGGTYFPPEDVQGRPGFPSILSAITGSWKARRDELLQEGRRITGLLSQPPAGAEAALAGSPDADFLGLLERSWSAAWSYFNESYDATSGGFGGAPKFPQPSNLFFLLRLSLANDDTATRDEARRMVTHTLSMMARGGVHDHVGGGFHRYSVDDSWFVPHFEKMLYDQGQLAALCLEAWQADGDGRLAWLARDILTYVLRDLRHPTGAFYAAEDADSPVDRSPGATRREGAFYVWRANELRELLGDDHALAVSLFSIQEAGNVPPELDPHGEMTDRNVLHQPASLAEIAARAGLTPSQAVAARLRILDTLLHARGRRPRPLRDEKIVAAWNGLMLSALSRGALCTDGAFSGEWTELPLTVAASSSPESGYALCLRAAHAAAAALRALLWDPAARRLHRSFCDGQRGPLAVSEDYACLIQGLLDLYEAGLDPQWLLFARELQAVLDELFWDESSGGYFCSSSEAGDLILRLKDEYDGAEPSASCVSARNLFRLSALLDVNAYRQRAERTLASLRARLEKHPQALPGGLCALEWAAAWPPRLVVLSGDRSDPRLLAAARAHWREAGPPRVLLAVGPSGFGSELCEGRPWLSEIAARVRPGEVLRYVCDDGACSAPEPAPLLS